MMGEFREACRRRPSLCTSRLFQSDLLEKYTLSYLIEIGVARVERLLAIVSLKSGEYV